MNLYYKVTIWNENKNLKEFNFLLKPVASCCEYLNPTIVKQYYEHSMKKIFEFITKLEDDFKDKVNYFQTQIGYYQKGSLTHVKI